MCFLNMEAYLAESVESVLRQDYETWELLLMDDGSTDTSSAIARAYAAQHPDRIRYWDHEGHRNRGTGISRNLALAKAAGQYIAFLDADDVWLPTMLTVQLGLMQQHAVAMVSEATEYWYDWEQPEKKNVILPVGAKQDCVYFPPQLLLDLYPLGQGAAPCICGMLVRKDAIDRHGGFANNFVGMYDDQTLLVKLYLHEKVFISSGCHNRYRQRQDSLVHSAQSLGSYPQDRRYFLQWLKAYLATSPSTDSRITSRLKQALSPPRATLLATVGGVLPTQVKQFLKALWQPGTRKNK